MALQTKILAVGDSGVIEQAVITLNQGSLVAFPTDTVYGLGASAFDAQAIEQLYLAKGRQAAKAIAVLIGDLADLGRVAAEMGKDAGRLARRFWPGPLTLVVPRHPALPSNLSPLPTVGVRMPDHPVALELLRLAGPLAVTSANLSEFPSAASAQEVLEQLGGRIPLILDGGRAPGGLPSTVVDCTQDRISVLRSGPISQEQLLEALS
jgi:L-threonylcarbamoyladenylate synthase